ncbi:FAD-dependent oxidoreductase [Nocardia sp. CA-151230]|uniref:FAD-dependent oxidoreductase n=1 Tax=Nocardia sp. CA-151230 TaxID=3239982 RepID=UPI003D8B9E5B
MLVPVLGRGGSSPPPDTVSRPAGGFGSSSTRTARFLMAIASRGKRPSAGSLSSSTTSTVTVRRGSAPSVRIVTAPGDIAERIIPGLPQQRYRVAFNDITYGRYVVVGFFTEEVGPQRWDDFFGVSTPQLSFQAVFNHAAAMRNGGDRKPGGALACSAGGAHADALLDLPDEEILSRFTKDLLTVFPELDGKLGDAVVREHHRVVPFWAPGRRNSLPTLRNPLGSIYLAGDYQLDLPSLADAAASGEQAGKLCWPA